MEKEEQSVFLDIACCFKGYHLVVAQHILRAHYSYCVTDHTRALVDNSLIHISSGGEIRIDDLTQDMGKEIAEQESQNEPEKCSRLWIPEAILHVLEHHTVST